MKKALLGILLLILCISCDQNEKATTTDGWQNLKQEAKIIGKPEWRQLLNNIKNQEPHGLVPGSFWMPKEASDSATWSRNIEGHPPVWVFAVDDYIEMTGQDSVLN